ncbi:MAG: hypothetical protein ACTSR7_12955 [Promethearchaeota archaeon]
MSTNMLEKDEEILWQSKINVKFQTMIFFISLVIFIIGIGILIEISKYITSSDVQVDVFFLVISSLVVLSITGIPLTGICYGIYIWVIIKYSKRSYFATNNKIVDKREKKEYIEYFTFEYSKINKIEIRSISLFKKNGVSIRIFPKFNSADPYEWSFQFFKDTGVKLPKRLEGRFHVLFNASDYESLLGILEKYQVQIIIK